MKGIGTEKPVRDAAFAVVPLIAIVLIILFMSFINDIEVGRDDQALADLENTLKRTAMACYASEGIYPPNVEYLEEHYGVQINDELFWVDYKVFASNIMPEITVLRKDEL